MNRLLIKGGRLVTPDRRNPLPETGDILIEGEIIKQIAPEIEAADAEIIDAKNMIVMAGLVNAHQHTWQTNIRGIAGDWTMADYQKGMHRGLAMAYKPEDIYLSNLVGALNQINSGTTTLFDWSHNNPTPDHTDAAIDGLEEAGIRAVYGHGTPKPKAREGEKPFWEKPHPRAEIERLKKGRLASDDQLITLAMCILGPDYSTWEVTEADARLAREMGVIASQHMGGGVDKMVPDGIERMDKLGLLGPWINVVHGNNLTDGQVGLLAYAGATVTVTPEIEYQMGFGHPLTRRWLDLGRKPSLGGDVESDVAGDMFQIMRFALQMARGHTNQPIADSGRAIDEVTPKAHEALTWATAVSAADIGLGDKTGALEPGLQADIVLLRADDLNLAPVHDPLMSVIFQATPGNVDTVLIAGQVKKRAGRLVYDGLAAKLAALKASGARILDQVGIGPRGTDAGTMSAAQT
jgi:cytosine/adenosine deaminase-related metal-dependent hydrolase